MPNIADLTLLTHAGTNLVFTPEKATDNYSAWKNDSQGTYLGRKRVSVTRRASNSNDGVRKLLPKIVFPTIDGAGLKLYDLQWFGGSVEIPNRATTAEKQELWKAIATFVNSTEFKNMIVSDDQYF